MYSFRRPLLGLLCAAAVASASALTLTTVNVAVTEDFNTLGTSTGSAVPPGWEFLESGSGANLTYGASNGSSATGNAYSFGATSATDRAFGSLRTSAVAAMVGTVVTNLTGETVTQLDIQYYGEQWRLGATGRTDQLDFAYSLDASSVGTGTWFDVDALDFVGPVTAGVTGALDGNDPANRVLVSYSLSGLALAPGASLWLRWSDLEATGSDDGLGIDDFWISAVNRSAPPTADVPDELPMAVLVPMLGSLVLLHRRFGRRVQP